MSPQKKADRASVSKGGGVGQVKNLTTAVAVYKHGPQKQFNVGSQTGVLFMSASEDLTGMSLKGSRRGETWQVIEKVDVKPGDTPGQFSVGYKVENEKGRGGFLKASDLGMFVNGSSSFLDAFNKATTAHIFERDVLEYCRGSGMDRIVTALDFGEVEVTTNGVRDIVFFLVFELAKGDIRGHVTRANSYGLYFAVSTLHNVFVAAAQLHKASIAHNDIKPANTLVINEALQKIADLGRATSSVHPAAHDAYLCTGDVRFAPPEQLYPTDQNCGHIDREAKRRVGDLFNLGSLIYFMLTSRMFTPELVASLRPEMRPRNLHGGSQDSYQSALPYWKDAHQRMIRDLPEIGVARFGPGSSKEILPLASMVKSLCDPDPLQRGHPLNRHGAQNKHGLQRYISELDSLRLMLRVKQA